MQAKQRRHCEFINAVKEGNLSTVRSFLRRGIDVDASIDGGQTALHKVRDFENNEFRFEYFSTL
jgi:hypothetical protein